MNAVNNQSPEKIEWSALEYEERKKSNDWFWMVGIIAIIVAGSAIYLKNILFAILILVGTFTLLLYVARAPRMVNFEINRRGIVVGATIYPYGTLKSFWLQDNGRRKRLSIESQKMLMPHITLLIPDDMDTEAIRIFLSTRLPEEEHPESFAETVMESLGF